MQQRMASMQDEGSERRSSGRCAESGSRDRGAVSSASVTAWMSEMASEWVQRRSSTNNRRAFMKTTMLAILTMALLTCFVATGAVLAEATGSSTIAGGNSPDPNKMPQDKRTDLTGGQQGVPDEYATTPVRQGKMKEVTERKGVNQPVTSPSGDKLGKITKVLKDEQTQNIEYVMFQTADGQTARPMPWSRFQEKGDKIVLNATKDELQTNVNPKEFKDMSPDLAMFMDEIEL